MQVAMPSMVKLLSPETRKALEKLWATPCPLEEFQVYQKLALKLELNPMLSAPAPLPGLGTEETCGRKFKINGIQALQQTLTDEPDHGMDQNLNGELDPQDERRWMGGVQGPNSQGFRHMYFSGWSWQQPFTTFQLPVHAVGQAPKRVEALAVHAQELIQQGDYAWGIRVMGWAMHFLQDLSQPFHTVQVPRLSMVPWSMLISWNPKEAFQRFVKESTRVLSNYHHAYERYVLFASQQPDLPFAKCLEQATTLPKNTPEALALEVSDQSRSLNGTYGSVFEDFFGHELKGSEFELVNQRGDLDYAALYSSEELKSSRERLHELTCRALGHFSRYSAALIEWTFRPSAQ